MAGPKKRPGQPAPARSPEPARDEGMARPADPGQDGGSTPELRELCRLRSSLEAFAVRRMRASPSRHETFAALAVQMSRLKSTAARGHHLDFHREDMALHRLVVEAAGLDALLACWHLVSEELDSWILKVKITHWPSLLALYREHEFLLEAWNSNDAEAAEGATHHHLEAGWYRVAVAQNSLPPEGSAVDRAASFLSTHYASRIDIRWMAENICFVSPSHLTRLFKAQFGKPPFAWLRQVRMERAGELLADNSRPAIATIARMAGYQNVSHFVKDFRAYHGVSPGRFRKKN